MIIRLRVLFKISFDSKSDYSLLKILLKNLFIKKFIFNLGSLISDLLNFLYENFREVNLPRYYKQWISENLIAQSWSS